MGSRLLQDALHHVAEIQAGHAAIIDDARMSALKRRSARSPTPVGPETALHRR
jgi:hypothetical protein